MTRPDLERDLKDWFADTAMPRQPDYVGDILHETAIRRQRPRWTFLPWRWLPLGSTRFGARTLAPVPWRAIGLIALLALLAVAALLIGTVGQQRRTPLPFGPAGNGLLAYAVYGDIWTVDPATGKRTAIVTGPTIDREPRYSLGGTRIAFIRRAGAGDLVVSVAADGTHPITSLTDPLIDVDTDSLAWSQDGRSIVIAAHVGARQAIFVVDAVDGRVSTIDADYFAMEVHWRPPDGRQLMFVSGSWPELELSLLSLDDGRVMTISPTEGDPPSLRPIGWTPDGRSFAYQVWHPELEARATHLRDIKTGNENLLRVAFGHISNDGTRIVGFDGKDDDNQVCVARTSGGPCVPIGGTLGPAPEHAAGLQWSPDDEWILSRKVDGTRLLDPDGRSVKQPSWLQEGGETWQRISVGRNGSSQPDAEGIERARKDASRQSTEERLMKGVERHSTATSIAIVIAAVAMSLMPQTAASQSDQPDAASQAYADEPGNGEILAPGAYVLTAVPPLSITFTVPAGWYKGNVEFVAWEDDSNSSIGFQSPDDLFADPCDPAVGMREPAVGPTASDLAAALGGAHGLTVGAVEDVTVAGYPGKRLDLLADPAEACDELTLWDFAGVTVPGPGPGASDSIWILDVDGTRLVIVTRTRAGAPPDVTTELESILQSIVIETP